MSDESTGEICPNCGCDLEPAGMTPCEGCMAVCCSSTCLVDGLCDKCLAAEGGFEDEPDDDIEEED